jgi:2-oxoglutarate dehydrogenase E2 component (dihydrolipoamide succinyltransferase)
VTSAADDPATAAPEADRSRFYSPVVRRIADEHGVDLERVEGTGIGGRVRKKDVLAFVESGGAEQRAGGRALHTESPYQPDEPQPAAGNAGAPDAAVEFMDHRREAMSPMRQAIARHLVESRRTAAHCTTIVEVDMARVAALRAALKEPMARRGVRLTYLAFVARATVEALGEFPVLNASVDGDELVHHDDVNLGIAVALDDGLIVPVIPKAQRLSLEGMAAAIADVAERARAKRLEPDEVHGGTFTITNPGQFGAVLATPIINQPQVGILDLEAIVKRPVVVQDPDGGDSIAIRPMTYLPMSWDHRALDGATAARFLSRVRERLERWERD